MDKLGGPYATIIADSISEQGHRLTTMECKFHRFILAEMNTHRVFSRNSASSRAIPYHKIRNRVVSDPAWPVHWGLEQKGMQSGSLMDDTKISSSKSVWADAKNNAVDAADLLSELGLHKSLVNRILEPFMWHTAIITSTEWGNFFNQRCHPAAQPEMKAIADQMQLAYYRSTPTPLAYGEWHLPYIARVDRAITDESTYASPTDKQRYLMCISVARCARVSYLTHDGKRDHQADIDLYEKLLNSGHWSPFEHVATPVKADLVHYEDRTGNFVGWKQFRKEFRRENRVNFIPNLPINDSDLGIQELTGDFV